MIKKIWNQLFLEERSSLSLSAFRIVVALTMGLVVFPTLVNLTDNYLSTAFKVHNAQFFPIWFLELIAKSPDWLVIAMTGFFTVVWFTFLIGFFSQISCILMTLGAYYFYALNSFHVGTLSWDIFLVTVFMMCVTNYHGDYFSVDAFFRKTKSAYQQKRPFFIQRLLQMQLALTFFYTALYKSTAEGNWITDNPIYYLVNSPPEGVIKWFMFREWFQDKPELCYAIGVFVVVVEFLLPFLLFIKKTRAFAILHGIAFHFILILTMDVPATFFWLFPPMFLLFIDPDILLEKVNFVCKRNQRAGRAKLLYDGDCIFCQKSMKAIEVMDLFGWVEPVNFRAVNLPYLDTRLSEEKLIKKMHLLEPCGKLTSGFFAIRRLALKLPFLFLFLPLFYFPLSGLIGDFIYRVIAKYRFLLMGRSCGSEACRIHQD